MVENPKKSPRASKTDPNEQLASMTAFNGAAMEVFRQACQAYATGLATLNGELMSFVNTRLKHDADLGQALAKCSNWADAANLQQEWAQKASQEYLLEAGKLMEVASKVAQESWQPVSAKAEQAIKELQKTAA